MSDKEKRLNRNDNDKREQIEQTEEKSSFRVLTQVVALIICLLLSFTVWLVVHYRADRTNDTPASDGEAAFVYSIDNSVL